MILLRGIAPLALGLGLSLGAATGAHAQQIVETFAFGPGSAHRAVHAVGDVDGDGAIDYALCDPHDAGAGADAGRVAIYSGANGEFLFALTGEGPGALFGFAITGLGDLDGDGLDDFAVGAPGSEGSGRSGSVFLYSGEDGALLRRLDGEASGDAFGYALAATSDRDADEHADLLVGSPGHDGGGTDAGLVTLFSSGSGNKLAAFLGAQAGDNFGLFIGTLPPGSWGMDFDTTGGLDAPCGGRILMKGLDLSTQSSTDLGSVAGLSGLGLLPDLDGDGVGEVLATSVDPVSQQATARVLSGADGSLLFSLAASTAESGLGSAFALLPDLDGDGLPDLALGEPNARSGAGRVLLVSSESGRILHRISGSFGGQGFGSTLALVGDRNGDGTAELAIGSAADSSGDTRVTVLSVRTALPDEATGDAQLRAAVSGEDVLVTLSEAPADAAVLLVVGTSLEVDASHATLHALTELVVGALVTDGTGALDFSASLPGELAAEPLYFEAYILEPEGSVATTEPAAAEETLD